MKCKKLVFLFILVTGCATNRGYNTGSYRYPSQQAQNSPNFHFNPSMLAPVLNYEENRLNRMSRELNGRNGSGQIQAPAWRFRGYTNY